MTPDGKHMKSNFSRDRVILTKSLVLNGTNFVSNYGAIKQPIFHVLNFIGDPVVMFNEVLH